MASDARGIESHGVARLPQYVKLIDAGVLDPAAATDGRARERHDGAGERATTGWATWRATSRCAWPSPRRSDHDLGAVAIHNSNHYGIAGYYAMLALEHDLIGISLTNSSPLVAPTGGRRPIIGTNPIAIAVPTGDGMPLRAGHGHQHRPGRAPGGLRAQGTAAAARLGRRRDGAGDPRRRGRQAGALLPLGGTAATGGYKGYGLGVMVDLLTGVLAGGRYGRNIDGLWDATDAERPGPVLPGPQPGRLRSARRVRGACARPVAQLKESERAPGVEEILVAGEKEQRAHEEARGHGVRLYHTVVEALDALGQRFGLQPVAARPKSEKDMGISCSSHLRDTMRVAARERNRRVPPGETAMKNLGDMAKRFLQEHEQGQQPQQAPQYVAARKDRATGAMAAAAGLRRPAARLCSGAPQYAHAAGTGLAARGHARGRPAEPLLHAAPGYQPQQYPARLRAARAIPPRAAAAHTPSNTRRRDIPQHYPPQGYAPAEPSTRRRGIRRSNSKAAACSAVWAAACSADWPAASVGNYDRERDFRRPRRQRRPAA